MSRTRDSSGLLALLNRDDKHHAARVAAFREDGGPYLIFTATLSENAWFLEDRQRFPLDAVELVLGDIRSGAYMLDWSSEDIPRIQALIERYRLLEPGFADAAVISCAERNGGRVLTTDFRPFTVVARGEKSLTILPSPA